MLFDVRNELIQVFDLLLVEDALLYEKAEFVVGLTNQVQECFGRSGILVGQLVNVLFVEDHEVSHSVEHVSCLQTALSVAAKTVLDQLVLKDMVGLL